MLVGAGGELGLFGVEFEGSLAKGEGVVFADADEQGDGDEAGPET